MRGAGRWLTNYVALLGVLALPGAGCSQQRDNRPAETTTTSLSTARPGRAAFAAGARALSVGANDRAAAAAGELVRLGKVVCGGLGMGGLGVRRVVQRLVRSEARPITSEATVLVRSAVHNLCPAQARATR